MDTRRCNSESCKIAAVKRSAVLDAPLATILANPVKDWQRLAYGGVRIAKRVIDVDWKKFNQDNFLMAHCSIVCSCRVGENGYYIDPVCSELVNNNGNAWSNEVLLATFRTFVGGDVFMEHVQIPELSKGKILDAVIRPVTHKNAVGSADVYWVDILTATHRKHADLVKRITSGELTTLSMGCLKEDAPILLPDCTTKKISDIAVGDEVVTHKGNIRRVTSLFKKSVQAVPLHKIEFIGQHHPLELTAEHPVLVATKESVRCVYGGTDKPCKIDSRQAQCFNSSKLPWACAGKRKPCGRDKDTHKYDIKFVLASDVRGGDYVLEVIPQETNDSVELTPDICRLLGLYAGDGCLRWSWRGNEKTNPHGVLFCLGLQEKWLQEEVRELSARAFPNAKISESIAEERNGIYISVYDADFAKLVLKHCGEGAWTKKFSREVMQLPVEKQLQVIGGLFDTDGCFYAKKNTMHLISASEDLCQQLHLMLLRCKIENCYSSCTRKASGFKHGDDYLQHGIHVPQGSSWMLPSKKNLVFGQSPENTNSRSFFHDKYVFHLVRSNTNILVATTVYNFSVEDAESYAAYGIAVHNCNANNVQCSKCGIVLTDDDKNCSHLDNEMLQYFNDEKGIRRIVAELCGCQIKGKDGKLEGDPKSVQFIEASWVERPAFTGAVLNHYISEVPKLSSIMGFNHARLADCVEDLFKLRVADVQGMTVLRVARAEWIRRQREATIEKVAKSLYWGK
jgi:hypothetical protein